MKKARVVILEGAWWSNHEVPLVLPYFHALSISHREIDISHRTFRSVDDISYYVARISKRSGAMLYFACHGKERQLVPAGSRAKIQQKDLLSALDNAKRGAVSFVHFGSCEMIDPATRRLTHRLVLEASKAKWCSGYTGDVEWLQSMFLDLALISDVFVPQQASSDGRTTQLKKCTVDFMKKYEQMVRSLGFSVLLKSATGPVLLPKRLHPQ